MPKRKVKAKTTRRPKQRARAKPKRAASPRRTVKRTAARAKPVAGSQAVDPRLVAAIALALTTEEQLATQARTTAPTAWSLAGRIRRMQTTPSRSVS